MSESIESEPATADEKLVGADRVIAVLTELADHPLGVTLDELAGILRSSKPTVHRALATLRRAGLAELAGRGVYVLGDEYLRLAFRNLDGRPETARIQPLLEQLAAQYGETAHYAVLSGRDIVYRAKMDPPQGAVRLTSVIGGRNPAYRTAVGKALLSSRLLELDQVIEWFGEFPLEQKTPNTAGHPGGASRRAQGNPATGLRHRRPGERDRRELRRHPGPPRRFRHSIGRSQRQRGDASGAHWIGWSTPCPRSARPSPGCWGPTRSVRSGLMEEQGTLWRDSCDICPSTRMRGAHLPRTMAA